jgi:hypothetical protein
MRPPFPVLCVAVLASCKLATEPRFVAITPDYAYTDGCTSVTLSGAHLGTTATATIGGAAVEQLAPAAEDPNLPDHAQAVGFQYSGVTPAGTAGFQDVTLTVDGEALTLSSGFYYVACPDTFHVDGVGIDGPVAPGATLPVVGCALDVAEVSGKVLAADGAEVATFPLVSDCRGANAHFDVPAGLADGDYFLQFVHTDGTTAGGLCAEPDSADTGDPCADAFPITVAAGGAR